MPGADGTGPGGMGPMTGRAVGYCVGSPVPGYMSPVGGGFRGRGGGRGFGRGGGFGRGNRYHATGVPGWVAFGGAVAPVAPTAEQELGSLRAQAQNMGGVLEDIQARIAELESAKTEK